jgi:hypothetical protein
MEELSLLVLLCVSDLLQLRRVAIFGEGTRSPSFDLSHCNGLGGFPDESGEAKEEEGGEGKAHHVGLVSQAGLEGNDRNLEGNLQRKWLIDLTPPQVHCFLESSDRQLQPSMNSEELR